MPCAPRQDLLPKRGHTGPVRRSIPPIVSAVRTAAAAAAATEQRGCVLVRRRLVVWRRCHDAASAHLCGSSRRSCGRRTTARTRTAISLTTPIRSTRSATRPRSACSRRLTVSPAGSTTASLWAGAKRAAGTARASLARVLRALPTARCSWAIAARMLRRAGLTAGLVSPPPRYVAVRTVRSLPFLTLQHRHTFNAFIIAAQTDRGCLANSMVLRSTRWGHSPSTPPPSPHRKASAVAPDAAMTSLCRCETTAFLSHLYIKVIILPRQARDKHRENSPEGPFCRRADPTASTCITA
jgi:hypothetical protein